MNLEVFECNENALVSTIRSSFCFQQFCDVYRKFFGQRLQLVPVASSGVIFFEWIQEHPGLYFSTENSFLRKLTFNVFLHSKRSHYSENSRTKLLYLQLQYLGAVPHSSLIWTWKNPMISWLFRGMMGNCVKFSDSRENVRKLGPLYGKKISRTLSSKTAWFQT